MIDILRREAAFWADFLRSDLDREEAEVLEGLRRVAKAYIGAASEMERLVAKALKEPAACGGDDHRAYATAVRGLREAIQRQEAQR